MAAAVLRIHPDPKVFCLNDPDQKLLVLTMALDQDPCLFHSKLLNTFLKCIQKLKICFYLIRYTILFLINAKI